MAAQDLIAKAWLNMWVRPRETIRAIVKKDPKYCFKILSAVYGFPLTLHFAQSASFGEAFSMWAIILAALIFCVFIGMIGISITSGLVYWTGKWVGGKGSYLNIRAAVAWANVTNIVNIAIWLVLIILFGQQVFYRTFAAAPMLWPAGLILGILFIIQLIVSIWSFVILLKAIGEVQGFSAWRALLNVIIPFIMFLVAVWLLLFAVAWMSGVPQ